MEPVKNEKAIDSVHSGSLDFASAAFARAVGKLAAVCWRPSGLPPAQAGLLLHIFNEYYSFPKFISSELLVNPSVITRLADKLIAKGLLFRMAGGNCTLLVPTRKAEELLPTLMQCIKDFDDRCFELLGFEAARSLAASLNSCTDKIAAYLAKP